jgi:hypothetical protein
MVLFCLVVKSVAAQDNEKARAPDKLDTIRNTEPLFFYGVDFSHVRISDEPKVSKSSEYSKVYPSAWISYLEKEIIRKGYVQRALRKRTFYYKQNEIISVSINVVSDFIIAEPYSFSLDTVKNAIKQYDLHQTSGIGLVLITENFNKQQERAYMWVVFFDIQKREVLWATEVSGFCKHMGYTAHWASGIIDGFKYFIRKTYRVPRFPMYNNF